MKNNLKNIFVGLAIIAVTAISCDKENETVSEVVPAIFPIVVLNGDAIIALPLGSGDYTDAGGYSIDTTFGASQADTTILSAVSNNVDASNPGFYSVKYTGETVRGFLASATRLILVSGVDGAIDYSGVYARLSNGQTVNITKRGPGLYTTDNVGGVAGAPEYIFDIYFGQINDTTIAVPSQPNPLGGEVFCEDIQLLVTPEDTTIAWVVKGSGFGTALRTFSHQ